MKPTDRLIVGTALGVALLAGSAVAGARPQPSSMPFDATNPPVGIFVDEWYAVMLNGRKCGQMRVRMERVRGAGASTRASGADVRRTGPASRSAGNSTRGPKAGDVIRTQTKMRISVRRDQDEVSIGMAQKSTESLDGKPLSFTREMYLGKEPVITEGTIENNQVTVTSTQLGQKLPAKRYALPEGAMLDWAIHREQIKRGLEPGSRYVLPLYEPSIAPDRLCPTTVEIVGRETIDLFGRKVEAIKTRQIMQIPHLLGSPADQETVAWVTESGRVVRLEMSVMDIPIEILGCSKSVAMAEDDPAELMVSMLVPLDRAIAAEQAREVTYRIRLKGTAGQHALPELPETTMQKVVLRGNREITLTVTRLSPIKRSGPRAAERPEDMEPYLAATTCVNFRDPKVAELAEEAAGKEKDTRKVAEALCRFVHRKVVTKNLSVGFATASEVARSHEGDCTEHGVLLAALGRAKGIPTRLVTGLVYADRFGGKQNVLVGHLWTQFRIDGEWVDLDAALGETDVDPTHIAMALSAAGDEGVADLVTSTWLSLGQFAVSVVDIKPR